MNFEVFKKSPLTVFSGQWQWRLRTSGGQVVAKGASYPDLKSCMQAIVQVKHEGLGARVVNPENGLTFVGTDHEPATMWTPGVERRRVYAARDRRRLAQEAHQHRSQADEIGVV